MNTRSQHRYLERIFPPAQESEHWTSTAYSEKSNYERASPLADRGVGASRWSGRVPLEGAELELAWLFEVQLTPPFLHAARKNATLRATCASISASSTLTFTSNSARSSMGTATRSRKSRAVVARRSGAKAGSDESSSDCASSPSSRTPSSVLRSRAVRLTVLARSANRPASPTASPITPLLSLSKPPRT